MKHTYTPPCFTKQGPVTRICPLLGECRVILVNIMGSVLFTVFYLPPYNIRMLRHKFLLNE